MKTKHTSGVFCLICYLVISQSIQTVHTMTKSTVTSTYARDKSCYFQDKLDSGCVEMVDDNVLTSLSCARHCSARDTCEGFSLDATGKCYLHFYCVGQSHLYTDCNSPDVDIRYFVRKPDPGLCLNGGEWDTETEKCTCVGGFLGIRCERYGESCEELWLSGQYRTTRFAKFYFKLDNVSPPIPVYCQMLRGKYIRTHLVKNEDLLSSNGPFTFNHTWDEYVRGFYDNANDDSDGWIGLQNIYKLNTIMKLQTLFIVILYDRLPGLQYKFDGVNVGDNSTNYQFSYETVVSKLTQGFDNTSALAPCPSPGSPIPFSTPDVDNDLDANVHCAKEAGAGWWFSKCNPRPSCNPLGRPYQTGMEDMTPEKIYFQSMNISEWAPKITNVYLYFRG